MPLSPEMMPINWSDWLKKMGFASKLEDETEKRGGEPPRAPKPRDLSLVESLIPERIQGLNLDERSGEEMENLLADWKLSCHQMKLVDPQRRPAFDFKDIGKYLKRQKKHSEKTSALVRFLSPRVLRMRQGPAKRDWQRIVRVIKNHSVLI